MDRKPTMTNTKKSNAVSMWRDETQRHLAYMCVDRFTASAKNGRESKASNVDKAHTVHRSDAVIHVRAMQMRLYLWRFFIHARVVYRAKNWTRIVYRLKKK